MANRSSSASASHLSTHDASLSTLALSHPLQTFMHLRTLLGLDSLTPLTSSSSAAQRGVHPNLLLLNDEIRLKKELGVWGLDVPINSASLQRGDGMPWYELMCRLYERCEVDRLTAFVSVMEREAGGGGSEVAAELSGVRRWQRTVADRGVGRYCERALQCLPPLSVECGKGDAESIELLDQLCMDLADVGLLCLHVGEVLKQLSVHSPDQQQHPHRRRRTQRSQH
jgi:hypothetical protein